MFEIFIPIFLRLRIYLELSRPRSLLFLFTSASWTSRSPTRDFANYCSYRRRSCISDWLAGIEVFLVAGIVAPKRFFEYSGIKVIVTARRET